MTQVIQVSWLTIAHLSALRLLVVLSLPSSCPPSLLSPTLVVINVASSTIMKTSDDNMGMADPCGYADTGTGHQSGHP